MDVVFEAVGVRHWIEYLFGLCLERLSVVVVRPFRLVASVGHTFDAQEVFCVACKTGDVGRRLCYALVLCAEDDGVGSAHGNAVVERVGAHLYYIVFCVFACVERHMCKHVFSRHAYLVVADAEQTVEGTVHTPVVAVGA